MRHIKIFLTTILLGVVNIITAQENTSLEGIWKMRGYGWTFSINKETVQIYDTTTISCLPSETYPIEMLVGDYEIKNNVLITQIGVSTYTLDRLNVLPDLCLGTLSRKQKKDPVFNFEVLWNTFKDQYAYFEVRDVNWDTLYAKYKSQITSKTSQLELYKICDTMLAELKDGHVGIEASDKIMKKASKGEVEDDVKFSKIGRAIASHYVDDLKNHNLTRSLWGKINDRVGFYQVNAMGTQAYFGVPRNATVEEAQKIYIEGMQNSADLMADEISGINKTMHQVLKDVEGVDHLIIDVRFNGGGFDAVSFEILRFLINKKKTVFKKYARLGDKTTDPYLYEIEPEGTYFDGKVYFLQSHFSASATETMLLASLQLPNTKRIGSNTEGIFSDALEKVLPNGWGFSLSNEAYLSPDDINYESLGIPTDYTIEYNKDARKFYNQLEKDLPAGDKAIEWVLDNIDK